jgi:hypothetical protein
MVASSDVVGGSVATDQEPAGAGRNIRRVKLSDINANPFRNEELLPVEAEQVRDIVASIQATGLWAPPVVRPNPEGDGFQLAFGHTRLAALRELHGEDAEVEVRVQELSNERMFGMLVDENRTQRGYTCDVFDHDVRQLLLAVVRGQVHFANRFPPQTAHDKLRRFSDYLSPEEVSSAGADGGEGRVVRPDHFTARQVAAELGQSEKPVKMALRRIQLRREDILSVDATRGLSSYVARVLTEELNRFINDLRGEPSDEDEDDEGSRSLELTEEAKTQACGFASKLAEAAQDPDAAEVETKAKKLTKDLEKLAEGGDDLPPAIANAAQLSNERRTRLRQAILSARQLLDAWLAALSVEWQRLPDTPEAENTEEEGTT